MSSPLSDALSTLSDRGLRRLLGARTFLRGLDYARRKVVEEVEVGETEAHGRVRGSEAEPYVVQVALSPDGIRSQCSCPAFAKSNQHCKHVAALLITVRDQARGSLPRRAPPAAPAIAAPAASSEPKSRRRDRRRRGGMPVHVVPTQIGSLPEPDAVASPTGIGAWLPPDGLAPSRPLEYRVHVRQGAITVTVLDTEARVPLLPSQALAWQALRPTPDREPLRVLARFESGNPRHPAVDVRGEDVAELLPLLRERRVLLEPALMQLRFTDDQLKPRFDLELVNGDTFVVKASFERTTDGRRFSLGQGGWFEGAPGWHIDTNSGTAYPTHRRVAPAALRRLLRSPTIAEPIEKVAELIMAGLPRVALEVGAELPDLTQVADVIDLEPSFRLSAQGDLVGVEVGLYASYGDVETQVASRGLGAPVLIQPPDERNSRVRCYRCDIPAHQDAVNKLLELGLVADEQGKFFIAQGDAAIRFWSEGLGSLPETWTLYVPDDLVDTHVRSSPISPFGKVSSGVDWLSIKVGWESEGVGATREELARCLATGQKYVKLEDGSYATFDAAQVRAVLDREIELMTSARGGKLSLAQAGRVRELEDLLNEVGSCASTASTKKLFEKLADINNIGAVKKPKTLKAKLRPYQDQGIAWLKFIHDIGSGGVLADDMGLGKTLQAIALFLIIKAEEKRLAALVVAPTSVVHNWEREIQRFAPTLKVTVWHGADRREQLEELQSAEVIITSYALLRRDVELLQSLDLTYCVLDEAQHIKNPTSATAQAAKKLQAAKRLALTGTPIENRLSEIWSIFDFVSPGLLGPLDKFEERFSRPIDQGDSKAAERLRAIIHPFILRRTKLEVARDLPEKLENDRICELAGDQKAIYAQVAREVRAQVMGEVERVGLARSQLHILAGLTKLRQAACDPRLLGLPREFAHEDSGKLIALRELVEECISGGHKVLIFSQFVSMLQIIRHTLDEDGVKYEYLDGSTKDRAERVNTFQTDPAIPVFLISLKAGGTGLNLTAADTVIHYDPWWNPAVEDQATDRAHRIGQTRVVTTYRLMAEGTIEEKILQLKAKKRELVAAVLSEDVGGAKKLTKADLEDLFSIDS